MKKMYLFISFLIILSAFSVFATEFPEVSMLNPDTGALWPGGQYGSTKPANPEEDRGKCINCHWPARWDDDDATLPDPPNYPLQGLVTQKFPKKWVEQYDITDNGKDPDDAEDLCYTCHDADGPSRFDIKSAFEKPWHMPIKDSEQNTYEPNIVSSVECRNCHDPHQANSENLYKGIIGRDINNNEMWIEHDPAAPYPDNQVKQYALCFNCHGDDYYKTTGKATWNGTSWESPIASGAISSNKRLQFNPANSAYHPVVAPGRNKSPNLNEQLLPNLTGHVSDPVGVNPIDQVIKCTDCHNNDVTENTPGRARNYTGTEAQGPKGSIYPSIRRANYWKDTTTWPTGYNANNFNLCFRCHDKTKLVETRYYNDGARTNFYGGPENENLHYKHVKANGTIVCKNCHYNIHSNYKNSSDPDTIAWNPNTQYRVKVGTTWTLYNEPPANTHTHLINFSPDVLKYGIFPKPEWRIDKNTKKRYCFLNCHGLDMAQYNYGPPPAGDDPNP